jgi:hypothetical protein
MSQANGGRRSRRARPGLTMSTDGPESQRLGERAQPAMAAEYIATCGLSTATAEAIKASRKMTFTRRKPPARSHPHDSTRPVAVSGFATR